MPRVGAWINGAFGVGKTSVAQGLLHRWPHALLFDPEEVGLMLRRVLPRALQTDDFQDLPAWRELTVASVVALLDSYRRPLVVPMTLADPAYFDAVVGGLRRRGIDVHHFTLTASPGTVRRRIRRRLSRPSSRRWALARVDRCVEALAHPRFEVHVDTERDDVAGVVEAIAGRLPAPLTPGASPSSGS